MECPFDDKKTAYSVKSLPGDERLAVDIKCDDTVAAARQKVADVLGVPASSVLMWSWQRPAHVDAYVFASAVVASSNGFGSAALSQTLSSWTKGIGVTPRDLADEMHRAALADGNAMTRAVAAVRSILSSSAAKDGCKVAVVLGARLCRSDAQSTVVLPASPSPFGAPVKIDLNLVGPDGQPRLGRYTVDLDAESDTLERLLEPGTMVEVASLESAERDAAGRHRGAANMLTGHLGAWFPMLMTGALDQTRVLPQVSAHADLSIEAASMQLSGPPLGIVSEISLQRLSLRSPALPQSMSAAASSGAGAQMLTSVFGNIHVNVASGVIATKLFNGSSTAFRVNRTALADVDPAVVRRWATPVIVKTSSNQPKLWVYTTIATVIISFDLSVSAYVNAINVPESDAEAWISGRIARINDTIMESINAAVHMSLPSMRMDPFRHMDQSLSFMLNLRSEGTSSVGTPNTSALVSVIEERMSAFFVVLSDVPSICLLYKRSPRVTRRKNASDLVRLMRSRPPHMVQRELVTMFGMSPTAAANFYTAQMTSLVDGGGGSVWASASGCALMRFLDFAPSVQVTKEIHAGFRAALSNVPSLRIARRIAQLLQVAFSMASRNGIPHESMPAAIEIVAVSTGVPFTADVSPDLAGPSLLDAVDALDTADDNTDQPSQLPAENVNSRDYILDQLKRADGDLFRHKSTEYATNCGHNQGRQPVVVTRDELENIERKFPGSHTGAIVGYGSTPEKAKRNAYICPSVWCPKSRVALSTEQFKALGKKCPYPNIDEQPVTFDTKYFDGKSRYAGFLDGSKHPAKMCMPCCFIKPNVRVDQCGATLHSSSSSSSSSSSGDSSSSSSGDSSSSSSSSSGDSSSTDGVNIRDKYIRGDVVPLQQGRYGLLPQDIMSTIGVIKCGNREDGSGQLINRSNCYARCGIRSSSQNFMTALAYVLFGGSSSADARQIVQLIKDNLTAEEFVTLSGGRLCRTFMNGIDPVVVARSPEFVKWHGGRGKKSAESYLERFSLSDKQGHKEMLRDALVWAAMQKYIDWLSDDREMKTHIGSGLLELASRPIPWLNPSRLNILLIERPTVDPSVDPTRARTRSYIACPESMPSSHWRLSDPVAIIIRQREYYEPVAEVKMTINGIVSNIEFSPESIPSIGNTVRILLNACGNVKRDSLGTALAVLDENGHAAATQVVDYSFRTVGFVTTSNLFVPLAWNLPIPVLVGGAGTRMSLMYLSDIGKEPTKVSAAHAELLFSSVAQAASMPGIEPVERLMGGTALRLANDAVVPLAGFDARSSVYLPSINALINSLPDTDERVTRLDSRGKLLVEDNTLRTKVSHAMLSDNAMAREVAALRSPRHPLSIDDRRVMVSVLLRRVLGDEGSPDRVAALADRMLFHPRPLQPSVSMQHSKVIQQDADVELLSDTELVSGVIEVMLSSNRMHPDPPTSRKLLRRAAALPGPPYVQTDVISLVQSADLQASNNKTSSASSSHRSKKLNSTKPLRVYMVDPYIVFHLAHRMLHPDAYIPFAVAVRMVQERLAKVLKPSARRAANQPVDGTLRALISRNVVTSAVIDAVAERGLGYTTSTFEIRCLSEILGVPVKLTQPTDSTISTKQVMDSDWLVPPGPEHTHHIVLNNRADGLGHDLVMSTLRNNLGHGILFKITERNEAQQRRHSLATNNDAGSAQ